LGLLVPLTDERAPFGPQLVPLVESVVRVLNSFGGYKDKEVELFVRDEGLTPDEAQQSTDALIETDKVDVVIGPFSSVNAPRVIPVLTTAGIGTCSPSVSSQLMDILDDDGLFIRTTTLDSAIIENMVDLAVQSGSEQVSIAYPDDPYGRTLVRKLQDVLDARQLEVVSAVAYQISAIDYQEAATLISSDGAQVELIIGDPIDGPRFLNAVVAVSQKSVIITNDTLVNTEVIFNSEVSVESRPRILSFTPNANLGSDELLNVLRLTDPNFDDAITQLPSFAVNTVDCIVLFWLAALTANSDDAQQFKGEILRVANEGSSCLWISDCKFSVDEELNIDYEGIAELTLDDSGNALNRPTVIFEFDVDGRAQVVQGAPNITLTG
jgi:branched-chain amino acid transport system substrate-binding protein